MLGGESIAKLQAFLIRGMACATSSTAITTDGYWPGHMVPNCKKRIISSPSPRPFVDYFKYAHMLFRNGVRRALCVQRFVSGADLVTFLKEGLSSKSYPMDEAPELPK